MDPKQELRLLNEEWKRCSRCENLCARRENVVFGCGKSDAEILIVGEAPGFQENEYGVPFVGPHGELLMNMFELAWPTEDIGRIREIDSRQEYFFELRELLEERIFFTNLVGCMPPDRRPIWEEINACRKRLDAIIYAVDPILIISIGKLASAALMGKKSLAIREKRGQIFDIGITAPDGTVLRYAMMPLLSPAFLIRCGDQSLVPRKQGHTYQTLEDIKFAMSLVQEHKKLREGEYRGH